MMISLNRLKSLLKDRNYGIFSYKDISHSANILREKVKIHTWNVAFYVNHIYVTMWGRKHIYAAAAAGIFICKLRLK